MYGASSKPHTLSLRLLFIVAYVGYFAVVLSDTWDWSDDNDTVSGIVITRDYRNAGHVLRNSSVLQKSPVSYSSNHWNVCMFVCIWKDIACCVYCIKCALASEKHKNSAPYVTTTTDVTIIEIEIEIVFLTEHRIESKSYFSCIPSNDLSIEA